MPTRTGIACGDVQRYAREAVLRQVVFKADRRSRDAKAKALQRWRLASATAAMEDLRWQQRTKSLERAAVLTETMLNRRDGERVLTGFQRWRVADAEVMQQNIGDRQGWRRALVRCWEYPFYEIGLLYFFVILLLALPQHITSLI